MRVHALIDIEVAKAGGYQDLGCGECWKRVLDGE
jgi:hypothetical protein